MGLFTGNTSDVQRAYAVVESHFENLAEHQVNIFRDGYDHTVIVVDGKTAFRFAKNQEYLDKMPVVSSFLKEFAPLSSVSVPVPEIFNDHDVTYEKYEFLPGKALKEEIAREFTTDNLAAIGVSLGSFLSTLHSFPALRATELGIPINDPLKEWQERYDSVRHHIFPIISTAERLWISNLFGNFLSLLSKADLSLTVTHFDIKPDHIIVNPESQKLVGIIDFGDMRIGDPAYDFTFFTRFPVDLTPLILKAYTLEKNDLLLQRINFYQNVLPVMDLDHSLEIGDKNRPIDHKAHLSSYIAASHLLQ